MQTEIEAKFLNVNHEDLRTKLKQLGAVCEQPMRMMKRKNFDYPDLRLQKNNGWIRVRDEGDKVTMCYKQLNDRTLHGTKEVELVVDDFEAACKFLAAIGIEQKSYHETKRESWGLGNARIELDEWPWVKPYIEIEAGSEPELKKIVNKLDLDFTKAVHGSVEIVYRAEYDVTDEDIDTIPQIVFGKLPAWLEKRRK